MKHAGSYGGLHMAGALAANFAGLLGLLLELLLLYLGAMRVAGAIGINDALNLAVADELAIALGVLAHACPHVVFGLRYSLLFISVEVEIAG
jgi:hypothetical protein